MGAYGVDALSFLTFNYASLFIVGMYCFAVGRCLLKQPLSVTIGISRTRKFQKVYVRPSVCL